MGVDLDDDYEKVNGRVKALKAYRDLKKQYEKAVKKTGDAFEKKKSATSEKLSSAKQKKDALVKKAKNQFQKLLDLSRLTGGKGTNTINLLKRAFIRTIEKIKPELEKILISEMIKALGCDQQQTYLAQDVYIKVSSIDLFASLKEEPESEIGKLFYEKLPVQYQSRPFSMNRELYNRIQSSNTYSGDTGQLYLGASGQPLFDIKFFDIHPLTGEPGGWYRVSLVNRVTNFNLIYQFLSDYFKTITVFDFKSVMASIMDLISGAISIKANIGLQQIEDSSKFSLLIQRVLGLCFDNATEIDVTGSAKLDTTGQEVNNNFFEFDEIDLRTIESRISNIKNGVVVFEDCDNVALPVNTQDIINSLLTLNEDTDQIKAAENLTSTMSSNPAWGLNLNATFDFQINYDFLNFLCEGIIRALLSPKIILPFMTMYKAISSNINNAIVDTINSYFFFFQKFKGFMINLVSRIGSIFVRELVDIIKKDILELVKTIVLDITKERARGILTVILKLAQFLIIGLQLIDDWRKCRSVIDDILNALNLAISTFGLKVPAPLLSLSQFLDGYSETRAFIGTVEELQKIGVPTDSMPDGSPNLDVLAKFAQIKAMNSEQLENGYIATYSEQTYSTPSGYVLRSSTFGKSF